MIKSLQNRVQDRMDVALEKINKKMVIEKSDDFIFFCSELVDENLKQTQKFKNFIDDINNKLPTIYWFEIISKTPLDLTEKIKKCREERKFKVPPTNENISSNILYVGKVRNNFRGRVKGHLGYSSPETWSLQLNHWVEEMEMELKLNYIQYEIGTDNIALAILEHCTAEELKPILGKHSL